MLNSLNKSKTFFIAFVFSLATLTATTFIGCEKTDLCTSDNPPAGCFTCYTNDDCSGDKPVCDIPNNTCVECLESAQCMGDDKYCDTASSTCVQCIDSTHCTTPEAPVCDTTTFTCTGCAENADCDGITGKPFCKNETCVECTVENEDVCDGNSCNPNTFACTTTKLNDVGTCEPCVTDTECIANHKCVPLLYQDADYGTFCMKLLSAGCAEPYQVPITKRSVLTSENDPPEQFCGISEDLNTCDAMLAFNKTCTQDGECIIDGTPTPTTAAICRTVNGAPTRCSYLCGDSLQCTVSAPCPNGGGYCGE
ncbi:MAG: hypothetical protein IPJ88_04910 [Myxococcales bacterium]|nr:MAG: hypothetical protein IPJ88_04910 [Myxococcales bacterium]